MWDGQSQPPNSSRFFHSKGKGLVQAGTPMKIARDFDNTYTADPEMWEHFVTLAKARGHEVSIVTYRYEHESGPVEPAAEKMGVPVVYTGRKPKIKHFDADVWIDDDPYTVVD